MLYFSNILFLHLWEITQRRKNLQIFRNLSENYRKLFLEIFMVVRKEFRPNLPITLVRRLFIWRSWGGALGQDGEVFTAVFFHHCKERSNEAISLIAPSRYCKQKVVKSARVKQFSQCSLSFVVGVWWKLSTLFSDKSEQVMRLLCLFAMPATCTNNTTRKSAYILQIFLQKLFLFTKCKDFIYMQLRTNNQ